MGHQKSYEFKCASCGEIDTIPFEPKGDVKCKDCFRAEREIRRRHAPLQRHNTRVTLPITCCKCGKEETLDHMPKGKRLDELMCTECTEETLGVKSRWNEVRQQKKSERQRSWRVSCDCCGTSIFINVRPRRDVIYECESCEKDHVRARGDALENADAVAGGVHKRKSSKPARRRVFSPTDEEPSHPLNSDAVLEPATPSPGDEEVGEPEGVSLPKIALTKGEEE